MVDLWLEQKVAIVTTNTRPNQVYLILIESTKRGYSAYSPDLPGCVAIGSPPEEVHQNMQDTIEFHLEGLQLEGFPIPTPQIAIAYIEVAA